jgi:hypothetical protein
LPIPNLIPSSVPPRTMFCGSTPCGLSHHVTGIYSARKMSRGLYNELSSLLSKQFGVKIIRFPDGKYLSVWNYCRTGCVVFLLFNGTFTVDLTTADASACVVYCLSFRSNLSLFYKRGKSVIFAPPCRYLQRGNAGDPLLHHHRDQRIIDSVFLQIG